MEARKRINEALPLFKATVETPYHGNTPVTNLFLMAEATDWQTYIAPTKKMETDPIIVGFDGLDLWWIDAFDLTNLEDYVIKEFPQLISASEYLSLPEHK